MNGNRQVRGIIASVDEKSSVERMRQEQSSVLEGEVGGWQQCISAGTAPCLQEAAPPHPNIHPTQLSASIPRLLHLCNQIYQIFYFSGSPVCLQILF